MTTNSPVEFTMSDDELLLYSYGLFNTGQSIHRIDCIPWIANKFPHHSLKDWITRFSELQRGLTKRDLSERVELVSQRFDISDYVSRLHKRGIEPHVDETLSDGVTESQESHANTAVSMRHAKVSATPDGEENHVISSDDDDDILAARPVRVKRKSGDTSASQDTPELSEAQIKARVEKQLSEFGIGPDHARARQSRDYVEQELGHVSLVHHQLSKLKSELTKKLNDLDRGLGYGGFNGMKPAVGFWGNDGTANGGAEDPVVSETDEIMAKFWDAYVSRKDREQGHRNGSRDVGTFRGQKRSSALVRNDEGEDDRLVKKKKNGDAGDQTGEKPRGNDSIGSAINDVIDLDEADVEGNGKHDKGSLGNLSLEESRELENLLLAESDSELSDFPSDVDDYEEELEVHVASGVSGQENEGQDSADVSASANLSLDDSFEEETQLKPLPKNFKIIPPYQAIEEEEDDEAEDDDDDDDKDENSHTERSEDDDDFESPVVRTMSRRRSAGRPNYKEIPPDFDEFNEESADEEIADGGSAEQEVTTRTRRTRARVVLDVESSGDDEAEAESAEETVGRRTGHQFRQIAVDESASEDELGFEDESVTLKQKSGRARGKKPTRGRSGRTRAIKYIQEDNVEEEEDEEIDEDEDEDDSAEEIVEETDPEDISAEEKEYSGLKKAERKKPHSFTDLFHNRGKNRVSLFSDSGTDSSSGSDSDQFVEIVAVPKNQPKVVPRKRIGPVTSLASRGRSRRRPKFESSSEEISDSSDSPQLDDDSDDDVSQSD